MLPSGIGFGVELSFPPEWREAWSVMLVDIDLLGLNFIGVGAFAVLAQDAFTWLTKVNKFVAVL